MPSVICSTETGKRSRSQPRRSSPAFASIDPKIPAPTAAATSCAKSCPDERRVVDLDVDLDLVLEAVALQEAVDRRHVVVVLVLGRLERLRLDEDRALEADRGACARRRGSGTARAGRARAACRCAAACRSPPALPRARSCAHPAGASRPCSARPDRPRRRRPRGRGWWPRPPCSGGWRTASRCPTAARRPSGPGARRRGPTMWSRLLHRLGEGRALGRDVVVVEAPERHGQLLEELEGRGHLLLGRRQRVATGREPRPVEGAVAEDVEPVPVEAVPVAGREAEVLPHRPAEHDAIGVVPAERQRVVGVRAFVADGLDAGEEGVAHVRSVPASRSWARFENVAEPPVVAPPSPSRTHRQPIYRDRRDRRPSDDPHQDDPARRRRRRPADRPRGPARPVPAGVRDPGAATRRRRRRHRLRPLPDPGRALPRLRHVRLADGARPPARPSPAGDDRHRRLRDQPDLLLHRLAHGVPAPGDRRRGPGGGDPPRLPHGPDQRRRPGHARVRRADHAGRHQGDRRAPRRSCGRPASTIAASCRSP